MALQVLIPAAKASVQGGGQHTSRPSSASPRSTHGAQLSSSFVLGSAASGQNFLSLGLHPPQPPVMQGGVGDNGCCL